MVVIYIYIYIYIENSVIVKYMLLLGTQPTFRNLLFSTFIKLKVFSKAVTYMHVCRCAYVIAITTLIIQSYTLHAYSTDNVHISKQIHRYQEAVYL